MNYWKWKITVKESKNVFKDNIKSKAIYSIFY